MIQYSLDGIQNLRTEDRIKNRNIRNVFLGRRLLDDAKKSWNCAPQLSSILIKRPTSALKYFLSFHRKKKHFLVS